MSKPFQIFLITFLVSVPMWWGINNTEKSLENLVYEKINKPLPQLYKAEIAAPILNQQKEFDINAKAAFSVLLEDPKSAWTVLYEQNEKQRLPIASLTKLMTALVVLGNYDLNQKVTISEKAASQEGSTYPLKAGEIFTVNDLLHIALIESSNNAAYAIAEVTGVDNFVDIMNWEAKNMGLKDTHFSNPTGLDDPQNYSTALDLTVFTKQILDKPKIWAILQQPEYNVVDNGDPHPIVKNTDLLLTEDSAWKNKIYGGKTGYTQQANGCLILVIKDNGKYLINVILGAQDRFQEMRNLINNEL